MAPSLAGHALPNVPIVSEVLCSGVDMTDDDPLSTAQLSVRTLWLRHRR